MDVSGPVSLACSLPSVSSSSPTLGDLPEICVASIIRHLNPPEICKLAELNQAFRGASWDDFVWESKLPPNYQILVHKVLGLVPQKLGKRDIYTRLCRPNTFDGGTKRVWVDKNTGGVCMSISSKGLMIEDTGIISLVMNLGSIQLHIFNRCGGLKCRAGTYSVFFRLHLGRASRRFGFGRRVWDSEHVHGWDIKPVRFELWTSGDEYSTCQCSLGEAGRWFEYHVGDFKVDNPNSWTKMKVSMTQIDCTHTKGGLSLDSVLIYPTS
ncbi:hypothetical protein V6N13_075285 [Hibiscus sabdariffa]|uniref:F-box domain-containing protein n=1 Tax=Hibiscus sabdariffa TaxID=183260 RepID=A0ABR2UB73_9ROSI